MTHYRIDEQKHYDNCGPVSIVWIGSEFFQGGCNFMFVLKATSDPYKVEVALIGEKLDKNTQPCSIANLWHGKCDY